VIQLTTVVGQRWQQTASVHATATATATATQAQERLDRAFQPARRRLVQPDLPDLPARRRRTPSPWQPASGTSSTHPKPPTTAQTCSRSAPVAGTVTLDALRVRSERNSESC